MTEKTHIQRFGETKFAVLEAVVTYCDTSRFGPTVDEIREAAGLSVRSSVQFHINDLIDSNFLTRIPRKHRSIRPTDRGKRLVEVMKELDNA